MRLIKNFKPYTVYQFSAEAYLKWVKEEYTNPEALKLMEDPKFANEHDAEIVLPIEKKSGRFYSEAGCSLRCPRDVLPEWCEVVIIDAKDFDRK